MIANEITEITTQTQNTELASVLFIPGVKLRDVEKAVILKTLKANGFNRTHAARTLGIGIRTLQRKLKKYGKIVGDTCEPLEEDRYAFAEGAN